jgi:hypothetical protein
LPQLVDGLPVRFFQHATDRRHVRQLLEPQDALHQRIVLVVSGVTQFAIAKQHMDDELHEECCSIEDLPLR